MNEELRKEIEEEAVKHQEWLFDGVWEEPTLAESKLQCIEDFKKGASFTLSLWQEAERWRKVDEELPEILSEEPYYINARTDSNEVETVYIAEGTNCIDQLCRHYKEWKPIH